MSNRGNRNNRNTRGKNRNRSKSQQMGSRRAIIWVATLLGLIVVLVIVRIASSPGSPHSSARVDQPISKSLAQSLTAAAGGGQQVTSGAQIPAKGKGSVLKSNALPEMVYVGADYCPYCAAERWSMIVALNRFGTFQGLQYMTSSASDIYKNTPTFTFYKASYKSKYLVFDPVELYKNKEVNGNYPVLQKPSMLQVDLLRQFDGPPYVPQSSAGAIPFIDVGNQFVFNGAAYDPQLLAGHSWQSVADALKSPAKSKLATAIYATANSMTAAICAVDGNQPAKVCSTPAVSALMKKIKG